jgi:hypothetical protein
MFMRFLAVAVLATMSLGFAPLPFPKTKKKTGGSPEEIIKSFNGTYRVVSYEYGNNLKRGGIAIGGIGGRAAVTYTEVTIKDGVWTQTRDLGGRKYSNTYQIKIDPKKIVSGITLTYAGSPAPTYFGVAHKVGGRVTVTYGQRGRETTDPMAPLAVGQYRWVLERTK